MSPFPARTVPAIRVQDLYKRFGGTTALSGVSLQIEAGERVALLGASGSGKSTLMRCLCGLELADRPGGGHVEILGRTMQAEGRLAPDVRQLRRRLGVIFQQFNLVGRLPVATNVVAGLSASRPVWRSLLGRFAAEDQAHVLDALEAVGLSAQAYQRASTLSGGQQQRAAIARALVQGADVLMADEPVASLDPESTRRVMELLLELNRRRGMTLLVTLHDVDLAQRYFDRVVALRHGVTLFDGPANALTTDRLTQLYGEADQTLPPLATRPAGPAANDPAASDTPDPTGQPVRVEAVAPWVGFDPA